MFCSLSCKLRIHIGKCFLASMSIDSAEILRSELKEAGSKASDERPARNDRDRCDSTGSSRLSSSRRGSALAVNCKASVKNQRSRAPHVPLKLAAAARRKS